ncbi:uncharacterized protein LOC142587574 isoform X3 [Dermacentor variabilis]|uniref:uncharacterized protein LOC142587574 isoform X3 n=1 Tax=Dermacentor variabilis TaxID=34621 RepID=UPI003F5BA7F9
MMFSNAHQSSARNWISERRPIAENYEGIFLKKQQNVMQLREPGHSFMAKETILYHSEKYHCAVIRVTPTLRSIRLQRTTKESFQSTSKTLWNSANQEKKIKKYKGYHFVAKQTILFLSETYRCAVIKVTPTLRGHLPYYDLRLWNSAVRQGPHEKCIARFMKLAPSGHVIYDLQCHDNLHHEGYLV